ncbi:hypothetical protein PLESTB_000228800 [Pleodorina starrii]|uniref:Uncharacterized protein n=1 Tax=Pleodorina starrii TaxID=330485 RepID=A0A9W6BCA5_9CHLO|nr:hypothetical protein PLESTB_000228800 [Pleodorina starrii]
MAMVAQGSSISSVLSLRNEVARRDYHVKEVEYLSYIAQHWASGIGPGSGGVSGQSSGGTQKTLTDLWGVPGPFFVYTSDQYNGKDVSQSYFTGLLIECASLLVDAHDQYQRSLTFKILRIDAGYKNAKKVRCADGSRAMEGTVAILNEINQVVAIFHGSGGLKELEEPLRRLKQRNEELGGGPVELIYVDNCRTVAGFLERLFVGAKVKEDLFHVLQRMRDTLPHGHPLADPFMKEYAAACKVRDPSDEKKAREVYGVEPSDSNCRSYIPRPEVLEPRVQAVFDKYKKGGGLDVNTGVELLGSIETQKQMESVLDLIKGDRISDPPDFAMHINLERDDKKPPRWLVLRGTSSVEGFHSHFHSLLQGYNTSPELAVHIMSLFLGRWNRDQSFKHGDADYGMYDYDLLQRVNDLARRLGHAVRYPEADVKLASVEEKMHFEWKHLQPELSEAAGGKTSTAASVAGVAGGQLFNGPWYQLVVADDYGTALQLLSRRDVQRTLLPLITGGDAKQREAAALHQLVDEGWWLEFPDQDHVQRDTAAAQQGDATVTLQPQQQQPQWAEQQPQWAEQQPQWAEQQPQWAQGRPPWDQQQLQMGQQHAPLLGLQGSQSMGPPSHHSSSQLQGRQPPPGEQHAPLLGLRGSQSMGPLSQQYSSQLQWRQPPPGEQHAPLLGLQGSQSMGPLSQQCSSQLQGRQPPPGEQHAPLLGLRGSQSMGLSSHHSSSQLQWRQPPPGEQHAPLLGLQGSQSMGPLSQQCSSQLQGRQPPPGEQHAPLLGLRGSQSMGPPSHHSRSQLQGRQPPPGEQHAPLLGLQGSQSMGPLSQQYSSQLQGRPTPPVPSLSQQLGSQALSPDFGSADFDCDMDGEDPDQDLRSLFSVPGATESAGGPAAGANPAVGVAALQLTGQPPAQLGTQLGPSQLLQVGRGIQPGNMSTAAVSKRGPNRLTAYITRGKSGSSRRLTLADTTRPVSSTSDILLFWELWPAFTKKIKTDWAGMTREWNVRVVNAVKQKAPGYDTLYPKRESHLKQYAASVLRLVSERDSLALSSAVAMQPYTGMTLSAALSDTVIRLFTAPTLLGATQAHMAAAGRAAQAPPAVGGEGAVGGAARAPQAAAGVLQAPSAVGSMVQTLELAGGALQAPPAVMGTMTLEAAAPPAGAPAAATDGIVQGQPSATEEVQVPRVSGGAVQAAADGVVQPPQSAGLAALMSGAAQPQPKFVRPKGSRMTGQYFSGERTGTGKGGKGTVKTCKACTARTGKVVLKAGHSCPFKDDAQEKALKKPKVN